MHLLYLGVQPFPCIKMVAAMNPYTAYPFPLKWRRFKGKYPIYYRQLCTAMCRAFYYRKGDETDWQINNETGRKEEAGMILHKRKGGPKPALESVAV